MITLFTTVSISTMIVLPVALAIMLRRRYSVPWWLFCTGMATFVFSQLLHIPLNSILTSRGLLGALAPGASDLLQTAILLGLTAGLSETVSRVLGYWFVNRMVRRANGERAAGARWQDGVMLGFGHGGIEAMGLVAVLMAASVSSLLAMQAVDVPSLNLSPDLLAEVQFQLARVTAAPWLLLFPLVERAIALSLHVILSLLVWSAIRRRNLLFLLLALVYHAAFDGIAAYVASSGAEVWQVHTLLLLALIPGVVWALRSRPSASLTVNRQIRPVKAQMFLFGTAVRKELQQLWRTKRMLVVLAVFLLFGLGSPLIARFTPELLKSIEGAEQFADLIPSPTRADSLAQYIKNLTQFGFIIAIVLGMGLVAGEKERGTAPMILSKPIPRWAFVVSKFAAQALTYGIALAAAALAAFYYTNVLFEPFAFGPFLFGNLLLWIWLLDFVAVTMLATVVGRTSGAAAGIALIGSVLLLLAGTIPAIAAFTPSGLVNWASQLGLSAPAMANAGALVANITLIIVFLITSVAVFETQEL